MRCVPGREREFYARITRSGLGFGGRELRVRVRVRVRVGATGIVIGCVNFFDDWLKHVVDNDHVPDTGTKEVEDEHHLKTNPN